MTYQMKKTWASGELGRLFETEPTDAEAKPSHFNCKICRRQVSLLTRGSFEILWHYQGANYFAMDQRLHLETAGWRVLAFKGKSNDR